ncbi:MAG: GspH/FimT family pseudopilin [Sedimentisphaerales bacterium]|nr:GspH/FimT family pseudopilin [Sedimentisphaerales bacterium]
MLIKLTKSNLDRLGFSMAEYTITLCIIMILASVASIGFISSLDHARLENAAARFTADLKLTRDQALRVQQARTLTIDKANLTYQAADVPGLYGPDDISVNLALSPYEIASITSIPDDFVVVTFNPRGWSAAGSFSLHRGGKNITIQIRRNGEIVQEN